MKFNLYFSVKAIIIIVVLSILFFPSFFYNPKAFALSIEEEKILGQKFLGQIQKHYEFVNDDFTDQFFNDLGHYLITPLKTRPFPFHFYIIKDNTLNAFAAPGGHIFFYAGLIEIMDDIDMLAGVLGHEIAHVAARHLSKRIEQNKKIGLATMAGVLAGAFIGGAAAEALITGSLAAGTQTQLHFSRNDERQADQLGFKYTNLAGFAPSGLPRALDRMQKSHWGANNIPPYLLTHPAGPERLSNFDAMLSNYSPGPSKKEAERFRALYPFFKTVVRAQCLESHEAEKFFNLELKKNPGSPLAHFGLGIVCRQNLNYDQAISFFKNAIAAKPNSLILLKNLSQTYQMKGLDEEAISVLKKASELDDQDLSILFPMAVSYENLGQYEKAVSLLERLASYRVVKKEVFYHLGISYGRQNRLPLAHYNFGLYFKKLGQQKKALFHFQKADELSSDDFPLKKKIRDAIKKHKGSRKKKSPESAP